MKHIALVFLISLVATSALAQKSTKVIFRKNETHRFSGLKLKGLLKKPELSYIYERKGIRAERIVDMPENFNDEIRSDAGKF